MERAVPLKSGWFITRRLKGGQESAPARTRCRKSQILNNFPLSDCLTLGKPETYTEPMTRGRVSAAAFLLLVCAMVAPVLLHAQAVQRSIYASALDQNGAPVADLGPSDFVVREDKVAREILKVAPASDPMQIV